MKCPFCNSVLENGYCKTCQRQIHELYRHPQNSQKKDDDVIKPEIVDSGKEYTRYSGQRFSFRQSPIFTQYAYNQVSLSNSCLTGIISLGLIFFVFLQLGFLAALGFAFFTVIGKVISLIITINSLMKGKMLPPFVMDIAIWIVSYCLVAWLA